MSKYKIIITLVIAILVGLLLFFQYRTIGNLKETILSNKVTITEQDNKIKEQLSTIAMLEANSLLKDASIVGLQNLVESNKVSCKEAMDKLSELGSIVSESTLIDIPLLIEVSGAFGDDSAKKIENKEETINVVDQTSGKRFIELRNNVIRPYK